jgi:hypothetical protein
MKKKIELYEIENIGDWDFAPRELLEREKVFPNQIAYHPTASVALMLKRSQRGTDYPMGVAGLDYILDNVKVRKHVNGPVDRMLVILMAPDASGKLRIVEFHSADTMRARFAGKEPLKGEHGDYYWVSEQPKSQTWRLNEEAF